MPFVSTLPVTFNAVSVLPCAGTLKISVFPPFFTVPEINKSPSLLLINTRPFAFDTLPLIVNPFAASSKFLISNELPVPTAKFLTVPAIFAPLSFGDPVPFPSAEIIICPFPSLAKVFAVFKLSAFTRLLNKAFAIA